MPYHALDHPWRSLLDLLDLNERPADRPAAIRDPVLAHGERAGCGRLVAKRTGHIKVD